MNKEKSDNSAVNQAIKKYNNFCKDDVYNCNGLDKNVDNEINPSVHSELNKNVNV